MPCRPDYDKGTHQIDAMSGCATSNILMVKQIEDNNEEILLSIRQAKSIAELWLNSLSGDESFNSYLLSGIISFLSSAEKLHFKRITNTENSN